MAAYCFEVVWVVILKLDPVNVSEAFGPDAEWVWMSVMIDSRVFVFFCGMASALLLLRCPSGRFQTMGFACPQRGWWIIISNVGKNSCYILLVFYWCKAKIALNWVMFWYKLPPLPDSRAKNDQIVSKHVLFGFSFHKFSDFNNDGVRKNLLIINPK